MTPKPVGGDLDPTAVSRKSDHITLAMHSQVGHNDFDTRFFYEPMLSAHPTDGSWPTFPFLGKTLRIPLWVSSMTGGTQLARTINQNLARACGEFGIGMGLGSCRALLYSDEHRADFDIRGWMGDDVPLFANLGIAQLERLIDDNELWRITSMLDMLRADGLIVHVNPMQEWMQPEGDTFKRPPLQTIVTLLDQLQNVPLVVKEVGQGFGPASLRALLGLPLAAIDFAAGGGTNFAKLELLRSDEERRQSAMPLAHVGHTAEQMMRWTNDLVTEMGDTVRCPQIIISGGVRDYLDGYYLTQSSLLPAIYGQASAFLAHAQGDYKDLQVYMKAQIRGLEAAKAFLHVRR